MMYTESDLLRLAKRHHNTKRTYLLINPLQGKHIPVSPSAALLMMRALGKRLADDTPNIDLVIGFAETATAVAAIVAAEMGHPCRYIHTTREGGCTSDSVEFREEHSHAVEQFLRLEQLKLWLKDTQGIAFVDDELSTGKTLANAVYTLRKACPSLIDTHITAGSLINRLSEGQLATLKNEGIRPLYLLHVPWKDYTKEVNQYTIEAASYPEGESLSFRKLIIPDIGDARRGVIMPNWIDRINAVFDGIHNDLLPLLSGRHITVLGTEEYMLPGLLLGARLEESGDFISVRYHATTRSPIGISSDKNYPISAGWKLHSFYDTDRTTFIYNLEPSETVLVVTDSQNDMALEMAMSDLTSALSQVGCKEVILIREMHHV